MTALTLTKRKHVRAAASRALLHCHNGCRTGSGTRKIATHYAWILGRETPLCPACAKAWPEMWEGALGPAPPVSKAQPKKEAEAA